MTNSDPQLLGHLACNILRLRRPLHEAGHSSQRNGTCWDQSNNVRVTVSNLIRTSTLTNYRSQAPFPRASRDSEHARQRLHGIAVELHDKWEPDHYCDSGIKFLGQGARQPGSLEQSLRVHRIQSQREAVLTALLEL